MRVCVVQLKLTAGTRAGNLSAVGRAVHKAAHDVPSPDLVVLPAHCDTGLPPDESARISKAMCQAASHALGMLAREWGFWIAAGCSWINGHGLVHGACLFDPDGDVVIRRKGARPARRSGRPRHDVATVAPTAVGRIAVMTGESLPDTPHANANDIEADIVAVSASAADALPDVHSIPQRSPLAVAMGWVDGKAPGGGSEVSVGGKRRTGIAPARVGHAAADIAVTNRQLGVQTITTGETLKEKPVVE